jgi:hypothetical protein
VDATGAGVLAIESAFAQRARAAVKTVERRLSRIFANVGVPNRAALASLVAFEGEPARRER